MTEAERRDARLLQVFVTGPQHWSHVGSKETALRLQAAGYLHRSQAGRFCLIGRGEALLIAARRLRPMTPERRSARKRLPPATASRLSRVTGA